MGHGSFDPRAYASFSHSTKGKTTEELYGSRGLHETLNPLGVKIRESRDSDDHPESTPLIVGLDVTGSMDTLADVIAREGLGVLFNEILDTRPITDPQLMFMGIGDANVDQAPLQVSQFESDNRIVEQLTLLFLEHGGGGNNFESYNLPWYFASEHTAHDSIEKRGKLGYLFTVGDEQAPERLTRDQIHRFIGDKIEHAPSTKEMLTAAQRKYNCFHIIIEEGDYASQYGPAVFKSWTELLGQHVIRLADHKKLAETIVSAIEVAEGRDAKGLAKRFGKTVFEAVRHLPPSPTRPLLT